MSTDDNPIKAAAYAYAERGFRVLEVHTAKNGCCSCKEGMRCTSAGKHPKRLAWQKDPRPSSADIETMFGGRFRSNIGIATGPDSGIFVVDLDGETGQESMRALINEHGPIPKTWTAQTGSGGWHFAFKYPDFDLGNSASTKLGKGIDTRGKGGFIVAPPSVSGKGPYVLKRDIEIAEAPEWLLELLRPKERAATESVPKDVTNVDPAERQRLDGYVKAAIDNEVRRLKELTEKGWDGPPWDITTYEVACNLIELANAPWSNLSINDALSWFDGHAPRDPGFDDARVMAKWDSALNTVGDNETVYPPKTEAAFWLDDDDPVLPQVLSNDNGSGPLQIADVKPEASSDMDDFVTVDDAEDAPPVPKISLHEVQGIPLVGNTLMPDYVKIASAQALGTAYRAKEHVELDTLTDDVDPDLLAILVREAQPPTDEVLPIEPVDEWVGRNLRSGTSELLWAALGTIIAGVDVSAPTIVFKGGGPLLAVLARILTPAVGDQDEVLLAGPRFSTRETGNSEIVFEFAEDDVDLMPYARSIMLKALSMTDTPLVAGQEQSHDDLDDLEDYRAAQLIRARRGLGSKPRTADKGDF